MSNSKFKNEKIRNRLFDNNKYLCMIFDKTLEFDIHINEKAALTR